MFDNDTMSYHLHHLWGQSKEELQETFQYIRYNSSSLWLSKYCGIITFVGPSSLIVDTFIYKLVDIMEFTIH